MKIAVAGVGYVGLVTAVTLADVGHDVICLDVDKGKLKMLKEGISPIYEYGLEELMLKTANVLSSRTMWQSIPKHRSLLSASVRPRRRTAPQI